jgi:hypothetical protein
VIARSAATPTYLYWKSFNATGFNLGGWLVQESTIDTTWWETYFGGAPDDGAIVRISAPNLDQYLSAGMPLGLPLPTLILSPQQV